ncbi:MAG: biotin transporter BioY [Terriglobales bacterium]
MTRTATHTLERGSRTLDLAQQGAIIIGASLFVAVCARVSLPLPGTPVPLTLQNFGVLLVGLMLGSRRGFAALLLYLAEGAAGLPVFSIGGLGGIAQLLGPTGGYLFAYPLAAGLAGLIMERRARTFARAAAGSILGDVVLFAGGITWLTVYTHSFALAIRFGLYWFIFAEVIKVMCASAIASGWQRFFKQH